MAFLDENYLFSWPEAPKIYEGIRDLPILDPHNHADVEEIVVNEGWDDIWEVEAATDHYVWEGMRRRGVPEEKITGSAPNREKWEALASVFPQFAGNPTYEWVHLDLKRRFGIEAPINQHNADWIWAETRAMLATDKMRPQSLLREMKVRIMCSTDDPASPLEYHQQAREQIEGVKILPTWRPDRAMKIPGADWRSFLSDLAERTDRDTESFSEFLQALADTHEYFAGLGCVASDHGLFEPVSRPVPRERAEAVHAKALKGEDLTAEEINDYRAHLLEEFGRLNEAQGWVTQLHIGPLRDYRDSLYESLGPDSGGDVATHHIEIAENLRYFLNRFDGSLKIVFYCLDPGHIPTLATLARAFPNVNLGAPWWFNDSPYGMEEQLKYIASVDLMWNLAGMVTDSRKLMSYDSRTEMFRRTLSDVLAGMVGRGQMPFNLAAELAANLSYTRPRELFFAD